MDRPTFSQSWSRVARLTPALRPQVRIHRQLFHGEPWHIVHDPVTNNFFRLNPVAYHLIGLLDGRRTIDEVWRLTLDRHGDAAPTQHEVIGLLGQMNESNLLRVDLPSDAAPLLKRQRERRLPLVGGQFMSILSLKFPVFNPNRFVGWLLPFFRPVLSKAGLIAWAVWITVCVAYFLPSFAHFRSDMGSVLDPNNWLLMGILFVVIKAWHELGHALVCRRFGGEVPEVGMMLLVLLPAPYVDATSSWNFPDKWKRLLVGAAGMMFELTIAGAAVFVWLHSEDGSVPHQLAYNAIFLASVTTLLFNANPLLRFDGYYILSDLLEIPNLYDRSARHIRYLAQRFLFGLRNAQPASTVVLEEVFLVIYGFASQIYKLLIIFGIAMFLAGKIPTVGALIAMWAGVAWVVIPSGKFLHWLFTSPQLHDNRPRAITVTFTLAIVLGLGLGVIPAAEHRTALGIIESDHRADLAVDNDAFIKEVRVQAGDHVKKDQIILIAESHELTAQLATAEATLQRLDAVQRGTLAKQTAMESEQNRPKIDALVKQIHEYRERVASLTLRSPLEGVVIGGDLSQLVGSFVHRGETIAQVQDMNTLRVTALMDQADNDAPFRNADPEMKTAPNVGIELRTAGLTERVLKGAVLRRIDGGRTELPHPALGYNGGGSIATMPDDPKHMKTLKPQFELWISLPKGAVEAQNIIPGERVHVRLTLADKRPLIFQWVHLLRQLIRDRLAV